jgi:hypothetical protein
MQRFIKNLVGEELYQPLVRKLIFLAIVVLASFNIYCTRTKYICAAYQSAFLLDTSARKQMFAIASNEDSTEPLVVYMVKKTDVLLIAPMSRKKKEKSWQTVPMITIYPPIIEKDSLDMIAADSTAEEEDAEEKDEDSDTPPTDTTKAVKPPQPETP